MHTYTCIYIYIYLDTYVYIYTYYTHSSTYIFMCKVLDKESAPSLDPYPFLPRSVGLKRLPWVCTCSDYRRYVRDPYPAAMIWSIDP